MLTYGTMVYVAQAAADETGLDAEIIDLRSLWPLDLETIVASVKKTGRCVIAHEATRTCGFGAELMSLVQEHCFHHLEAPISASPVGTPPTRMPRSGRISPAPRASARHSSV